MLPTHRCLVFVLAGAGLSLASCAPPIVSAGLSVAEAGNSVFFEGNLRAAVKHDLASVFAASQKALTDLAYEPCVNDLKSHGAELTARESNDGRLVVVTLKESSPRVTLVQVRVGLFGDQQISRLVVSEIVDLLAATPKAARPVDPD